MLYEGKTRRTDWIASAGVLETLKTTIAVARHEVLLKIHPRFRYIRHHQTSDDIFK